MSKKKTSPGDFYLSSDELSDVASQILSLSGSFGATDAAVDVSESYGISISVRHQEKETIEYNRDKSCGVTVYIGQKVGHATTSDFSDDSLRSMVQKAVTIAQFTENDPAAGLADPSLIFSGQTKDLSLFHPWDLSVDEAYSLACDCEAAGMSYHSLLKQSEGVRVSTGHGQFFLSLSNGFRGGYATSRHSLSCALLAEKDSKKQRDGWFSSHRDWHDISDAKVLGEYAAQRTLSRLGARQIKTQQVPVIFEAPVAVTLLGHLAVALSGSKLYRKTSFLLDSCQKQIFPDWLVIDEDPFLPKGLASSFFDDDGVATHKRRLVDQGVIQGYFLSVYSARKLGLQTTGHAGGTHNLHLHNTGQSLDEMISSMKKGLLVTDLIGFGVNYVTGDYSRGVSGYWIEDGVIQFPVEEITIAGNLKDMYRQIAAVGCDEIVRGSKSCGSILIEQMMVGGS